MIGNLPNLGDPDDIETIIVLMMMTVMRAPLHDNENNIDNCSLLLTNIEANLHILV